MTGSNNGLFTQSTWFLMRSFEYFIENKASWRSGLKYRPVIISWKAIQKIQWYESSMGSTTWKLGLIAMVIVVPVWSWVLRTGRVRVNVWCKYIWHSFCKVLGQVLMQFFKQARPMLHFEGAASLFPLVLRNLDRSNRHCNLTRLMQN